MEEKKKEEKKFIEREWTKEIEGHFDNDGFFITPNGSFWDPDYVYFNREGFDKHGGRYDENGEYIPGEGWDDELNCYESEKDDDLLNDEEDDDDDKKNDVGYTEEAMLAELKDFDQDDDDIFEGKDVIANDPNIEKIIQQKSDTPNNVDNNNKQNKENELDERESDEYEEIEDEEEKIVKKEENENDKKNNNIKIEKENKVLVVKLKNNETFILNNGDDKKTKELKEIKLDNNYENKNYNYKYYGKKGSNYKKNFYKYDKYDKKNQKKMEYKNYNDFEELEKKFSNQK